MTLTPLIIRLTISTGVYIPLVIIGFACHPDTSNQPDDPSGWWTPEEKQWIISELNRTTRELEKEINDLTDPQWNFREEPGRWSIAEIVEHLEMQNQLHSREISVTSKAPQHLEFRTITEGQDAYFSGYGTDTTKGKARWRLMVKGKDFVEKGVKAYEQKVIEQNKNTSTG